MLGALGKRILRIPRKWSIQFTISLSFTLVAAAGMVLMGLSLYLRFADSSQQLLSENSQRVLGQVNRNIGEYLRNMMRISDAAYYRVIKRRNLDHESYSAELGLLYETNRDLIVSIGVFGSDGSVIDAAPLMRLKSSSRPEQQDWFSAALGRIENLHFSTPHVQDLFEDADNNYRWVISLSRAVELTRGGGVEPGVLLVDMNYSGVEQICKDVSLGSSGYVYLIDGDGRIIYHPRQQMLYSGLMEENNMAAALYEDGSREEDFSGVRRLVTVKTVGYTGWKLVGVMRMDDVTRSYFQLKIFVICVICFMLLLMTVANLFVSNRIANPIKALGKSVRALEEGRLDVDVSVAGPYEIRRLGMTIRSMVEQMRRLMDDVVAEQEGKRKSELDALQAQINPHFLYNTLDSIVWMIENERYNGAVTMVTSLARLFRISLSKGRTIIPLRDELEHARHYLVIQKIRFKNRFTYSVEALPDTAGLSSIKLIVQPIVENAIVHGMEYMDGDGEITVRASREGEDLYIDVCDNGPGMTEAVVRSLLTEAGHDHARGSGIGLRNVHERIRLYYGLGYGLSIQSEPDEGTQVRIHLPAIPTGGAPGGKGGEG